MMEPKGTLKTKFESNLSLYERLGSNIEQALKSFLDEQSIGYLSVYHRIKKFDSFFEKTDRKKYTDPFNEVEDFCGIRVVCYYVSDIGRIEEIIKKEFKVLESQNKADSLGLKEFAYRSIHYIIKIDDSWTVAPNYRGLHDLKAEIQIRTVLMHAWAEIEHKLNYKSDAQVPEKFQRTLFRLSAKFEEADEQFEELKKGINDYKHSLIENAKTENKFDVSQDFNKDSFLAFLNFNFPNISLKDKFIFDKVFDEFKKLEITFEMLNRLVAKYKPHFEEIANDLRESGYRDNMGEMPTEFLGFAIQVEGIQPYDHTMPEWKSVVEEWRQKMGRMP